MDKSISDNGTSPGETIIFNPAIKILAHFFSFAFHPLFIPTLVTLYLLYVHPVAFIAIGEKKQVFKLLFVIVNTALYPAFAVFVMWRLKFIQSVYLKTQKERIIPYAVAMIFYFWTWYVSRSQPDNHELFKVFFLGTFITVIAAWIANIYFKISMHALATGGMLLFILWTSFSGESTSGLYASIALLITGIVASSRMIVSDHRPFEIYSGLLIGMICQLIAFFI
jgi:hypothetical protein